MRKLSVFNRIVFLLNIIFSIFLLISFFAPYFSADNFFVLSILALALPYLLAINMAFVVYWALLGKKQVILSLVLSILAFSVLDLFYKLDFSSNPEKESNLAIMSFNALSFGKNRWNGDSEISKKIVSFVTEQNPDVICFQEFNYKVRDDFPQYKHYYISYEPGLNKTMLGVLSKYPILNTKRLDFPNSLNNAAYVEILYQKDTVRIYNLHLQSFNIRPGMMVKEEKARLFSRLKKSFYKQQEQAEIVRQSVNNSNRRNIICGDFNNNQYSYVYNTIKGDMQDTFLEKGSGFGRTYNFWRFPLRIDFILADKSFKVKSHQNFDVELSDHFPVMASFELID